MRPSNRSPRVDVKYWVSAVGVLALLAVAVAESRISIVPAGPAGPEGAVKPPGKTDTPPKKPPTTKPAGGAPGGVNGESVEMTRPGTFKISFRDADIRSVLQLLSMQPPRHNIVATPEVQGKVNADLYDVTFDEALEAVVKATGLASYKKGNFVHVCTPEQLVKIMESERKLQVKSFRLHYITSTDAKTLLSPLMSKAGVMALSPAATKGIAESSDASGANDYALDDVLVVKDYEDNVKEIEKQLRLLDTRPRQVLIEATILRARLNEDNALGVDFQTLCGVDFESLNATSNLTSVTRDPLAGDQLAGTSKLFRTDFAGAVPPGGLTFGLVKNQTALLIRALESITDVTVLANPKLLVVNKQRGEVMVGNRDGYLTTTLTETTATQTVEFLETGTRLLVRPFIGDKGYVRLEIHPEDSSGSVQQVGASALPSETTTEVTSNVIVRDGHTIIIGGLFREDISSTRGQIPILGNLPIIGPAFRNTADVSGREEVIILITPRIVNEPIDEAVSEHLKSDIERMRMGARLGLQWWGRRRLAHTSLRLARHALRHNLRCFAMWHTDMALSLDPRMMEAMRIKERLTDKAYWSQRSIDSSSQYTIQRMIMQELGRPYEEIVPPRKPLYVEDMYPDARNAIGASPQPLAPLVAPRGRIGPPAGPNPTPHPRPRANREPRPLRKPTPLLTPKAKGKRGPTTRPAKESSSELQLKPAGKVSDQQGGGKASAAPAISGNVAIPLPPELPEN